MKKYSIKKVEKRLNTGLTAIAAIIFCIDCLALGSCTIKKINAKKEDIKTLNCINFSVNYDSFKVLDRFNTALDNNNNLTYEEKELIKMNLWVFIDNKDYMDLNYMEKVLSTLKIKYKNKTKVQNNIITKAEYSSFYNEIIFYNSNNIYDVDYSIFTHELYHTMQKKKTFEHNRYLIETVNTIFNEEYGLSDDEKLYSEYYYFTKMLIEIIGEEPFRKYQCYSREDYIIEELVKLYGNRKDACNLLEELDEYQYLYEKSIFGNKRAINKMNKLENEIIDMIDLYYTSKHGFSMENDLIMLYYYDRNEFFKHIKSRFSNNNEGIVLYEIENIDYFHGDESHNLIIYEYGPINLKKIFIGKNNSSECEEIIDNYEIIYEINETNRYLNNSYILKKHLNN